MEQLFKTFNIDGFMAKPFEVDELLKEVDAIMRKSTDVPLKKKSSGLLRKVCIIENDPSMMSQFGAAFVGGGYSVIPAPNGMEGIERVYAELPDVALVKLKLDDISGDMVILKLKQMTKTHPVRYVLYTQKSPEKTLIASRIGSKEGIDKFVDISTPRDLLEAVTELFSEQGK